MRREQKRAMEKKPLQVNRNTEEESWDRDLKHLKWGETDLTNAYKAKYGGLGRKD